MSRTPGPWEVHPMAKMAVHQPEFSCWIPQSEEDARLIASAPDLLEALKKLLTRYVQIANSGDCGYWNPEDELEVIAARAAIAKTEAT